MRFTSEGKVAVVSFHDFDPGKYIVKRDKKNRPLSYLVEELGWLSPYQTVKGILDGEIDGIVAHRAGKSYVKTRPDGSFPNNIDVKGRIK